MQPGGKAPQRGFGLAVHHAVHGQPPAAAFQRHFNRLDGARLLGQADAKAVGHHVQQLDAGARTARHRGFALGLHACETAGRQPLRHLVGAGVGRQLDRKGDDQARVVCRRARAQFGINGFGRIVPYRLRARAVKQLAGTGKQKLQVIVQLGHGADRGARAAHRVGLVDGNGRRHAVHLVDCRLVHAVQKLARIGAEGFHIAALAFGIQRVEHQARLARAAGAGDDGQLAGANVQVQVLKVVLSRSANADQSLGHVRRSFWGGAVILWQAFQMGRSAPNSTLRCATACCRPVAHRTQKSPLPQGRGPDKESCVPCLPGLCPAGRLQCFFRSCGARRLQRS